jgi:hypothetical protein
MHVNLKVLLPYWREDNPGQPDPDDVALQRWLVRTIKPFETGEERRTQRGSWAAVCALSIYRPAAPQDDAGDQPEQPSLF